MAGGNHNYRRTQELRKFFREFYTPVVRDYFDKIDDDEWNDAYADRGFTRLEAKELFLVDPLKDSVPAMRERAELFSLWFKPLPVPAMYAIPVAKFDSEQPKYKPQVTLKFEKVFLSQEADTEDTGLFDAELSFRLHWDEAEVNMAKITALATEIKSSFATPQYRWTKGTKYYRYQDDDRKYCLSCYADTKTDAIQLFSKVVSIQNDAFNSELVKETTSDRTYPQVVGTEVVLGKTQKKLRRRPRGNVEFVWAQFSWHKLRHPIILVDCIYRWPKPLLRA